MLQATTHRGPDATHQHTLSLESHNIFIGTNRLKILDLSDKANQPMFTANKKFALLFNGEIYNYYELRNQLLEKKVPFHTHSDTEVVLHWLAVNGPDGISALQGMFALAFIDIENNSLMLARDRHGMKPLYYWQGNDTLLVSSEIKSLLASELVKKKLNVPQVGHYLAFKHAHAPETLIEGVNNILPGQYAKCDLKSGQMGIKPINFGPIGDPIIPQTNLVREFLEDSLLKHIHADVPVGLLLSGGVDSTLLLALAQKNGISMPSFSIVNKRSDAHFGTDDYKFARLAAKQYNSPHEVLEVEGISEDAFVNYIVHADQPIADSGALMTFLISQKARDTIKVLLSGAGADEYFAGYNRHLAFQYYLRFRQPLFKTKRFVRTFLNIAPTLNSTIQKKILLCRKMVQSIDRDPYKTYLKMTQTGEWSHLASDWPIAQDVIPNNNDLVLWALNHDRHHYLPEDVLTMSDGMSMSHSIEMRMPYLDDPLVNYMTKVPGMELLRHGKKWLLKDILRRLGGKIFTQRSKEGFGLPLSHWLNKKEHAYLWEIFNDKSNYIFELIDWETFNNLRTAHNANKSDHSQALWSVIVLGHWIKSALE